MSEKIVNSKLVGEDLDILDENGNKTGKSMQRKEVHSKCISPRRMEEIV